MIGISIDPNNLKHQIAFKMYTFVWFLCKMNKCELELIKFLLI